MKGERKGTSTPGAAGRPLKHYLPGREFAFEEMRHEPPGEIRQRRLIALAVAHGEAMAGSGEEVPVEGLSIGPETRHQFLLHRYGGEVVVGAEENQRRAFEVFDRIDRMPRS